MKYFAKDNVEDNPFHKTSMCRRWASPAGCEFGERCNFAHGQEELRKKPTEFIPGTGQSECPIEPPRASRKRFAFTATHEAVNPLRTRTYVEFVC